MAEITGQNLYVVGSGICHEEVICIVCADSKEDALKRAIDHCDKEFKEGGASEYLQVLEQWSIEEMKNKVFMV
ncbi:MAG: hypothetical protein ABI416_19450 [Ginsengibacter sp.]